MIKTCKYCSKEFYAEHHQSKYCKECKAYSLDVLKGKVRDNRIPQICARCGKKFIYKRKVKYCSHECMAQAQLDRGKQYRRSAEYIKPVRKKYNLVCNVCGKEYIGTTHIGKACSDCRTQQIYNTKLSRIKTGKCMWCGKEYTATALSTNRRFCCDACNDAYNNKKTRAKRHGVKTTDDVYFDFIYERDNGICQLCGRPVDRTIKHPNLLGATLDHKIPLTKGGSHDLTNVQLAHWGCNRDKGNKLYDAGGG